MALFNIFQKKQDPELPAQQQVPSPQEVATPFLGQPLRMPIPKGAPTAPGTKHKRVTQRITQPIPLAGATGGAKLARASTAGANVIHEVSGHIEIALSTVLQVIPPQFFAVPLETILPNAEGHQVAIPLASILTLLPSGKVEFAVRDLVAWLPPGLMLPMEGFGEEASIAVNFPLPEIVAQIPPQYLVRRTDQKAVDTQILKMGDPFLLEFQTPAAIPSQLAPEAPPVIHPLETEPLAHTASNERTLQSNYQQSPELPVEAPEEPTPQETAAAGEPDFSFLRSAEYQAFLEKQTAAAPAPAETSPVVLEELPTAENKLLEKQEPVVAQDGAIPETQVAQEESASLPFEEEEQESSAFAQEEQEILPEVPQEKAQQTKKTASFDLSSFTSAMEGLKETPEPPATDKKNSANLPQENTLITSQGVSFIPEPSEDKEEKAPWKTEAPQRDVLNLNTCTQAQLVEAGCEPSIASKILSWRELYGTIDWHSLRRIPGVSHEIYKQLAGILQPETVLKAELNEIFGLSAHETLTLKEAVHRMSHWPWVKGCMVSGMDGLPVTYACEDELLVKKICAFAPRLFKQANDVLREMEEPEVDELHLCRDGWALALFRNRQMVLVTVGTNSQALSNQSDAFRKVAQSFSLMIESFSKE